MESIGKRTSIKKIELLKTNKNNLNTSVISQKVKFNNLKSTYSINNKENNIPNEKISKNNSSEKNFYLTKEVLKIKVPEIIENFILIDKSQVNSIETNFEENSYFKDNYYNAIYSSSISLEAIIIENLNLYLNTNENKVNEAYLLFDYINVKGILFKEISKVVKNFEMDLSTFILVNIYLDIFSQMSNILFTWNNIFLIFVSAAVIALKFNEDKIYHLSYLSEITDINLSKLVLAENNFIKIINYKLYITYENYLIYHKMLIKELK